MRRNVFNQYIQANDFKGLFITEMGWNQFKGQADMPPIDIEGKSYQMTTIAERNGFQIITCPVQHIPASSLCKKLDYKLRNMAYDYICIFYLPGTTHHQWMAPVKTVEKRDIVTIEYESADKADFLFAKIDSLSFDLGQQTTIVDVKEQVQHTFAVNSEKITKDFYTGFRKEHKAFADFITGIDDHITDVAKNKNKQWYTSVMLNRLMFCYFIQKKGFLNGDFDYLQHKLHWVRQEKGQDRFFQSFYRGFLSRLFHDGLNKPKHDADFEQMYGRIPYLNGGMFDEHQLEHDYADIDIKDEAFIRLFNFFDTWRWHLDTRITASGKDINPDVLGYIFEQYINDRAQMGAYYTKEDITEYIGKNCILPFLMDRVAETSPKAFTAEGYVWSWLKQRGDRYIYDAVKKGYCLDWQQQIPETIAIGIDTTQPNLLERRAQWNTKTPELFALPTEIWRETIDRLQRCESLLHRIKQGEITHINDFITYNLDIRSFVYDLLQHTEDHLFILHFYKALQQVTILDPTCGSGAFLFAAMNILEPLYEVCIERMQEFHAQNPLLFKPELEEISHKYRSNIQYFIFKSIILRNLYGVDIMVEATEIAKLRLFLKMVAVVEVDKRAENLGLDPLPDIDFNIRCGNTLVGYATEKELNKDLVWGDMFANKEFKEKVDNEMRSVATAYELFKMVQMQQSENMVAFKQAKQQLKERLASLNHSLNQRLWKATADIPFEQWLASHQPFHWLAEFYQIIHDNGGFDVIIGNPPYVEYNKKDPKTHMAISDNYKIQNYKTKECGNLYAYVMERTKSLTKNSSYLGMIVPISGHSTERMSPLVIHFYNTYSLRLHLNLSADAHPQKLFEGVKFRLCIFFVSNAHKGHYSTKYTRWYAEERRYLFKKINYIDDSEYSYANIIGKIPSSLIISSFKKMREQPYFFFKSFGRQYCLYHNTPVNWIRSHSFVPFFSSERDGEGVTTQLKAIPFDKEMDIKIASAIINSSLFFIWWIVNSDCYHLNKPEITEFKYKKNTDSDKELSVLADKLSKDMLAKCKRRIYNYKTSGKVEYDEFYMKLSKPIIDEIDKVLAKHYGFTEEELDFIINYDIKYRMGDELNDNE
ncbi:MAG: Eco57I restriction-modification methylase domain-containing protein [Parabacteroides sp.]